MPRDNAARSMPSAKSKEAGKLARKKRRLEDVNSYGRAKAVELGITEDDVIPLIHEFRKERREKK